MSYFTKSLETEWIFQGRVNENSDNFLALFAPSLFAEHKLNYDLIILRRKDKEMMNKTNWQTKFYRKLQESTRVPNKIAFKRKIYIVMTNSLANFIPKIDSGTINLRCNMLKI